MKKAFPKLTTKKQIRGLVLLLTFVYIVSYITRINYGTVIVEMERKTGLLKSLLSMAVTGSFITYGIGQIISGILGDRVAPKKLVLWGLVTTVCMNLLIPICKNPYQMLFVWCINGFAQSFMWPPMVKIMTTLLSEDDYKKGTVRISWGSSVGTIVLYLISPVLISFFSWKSVFIFSAICGALMIIFWEKFCYDIPKEEKVLKREKEKGKIKIFSFVMILIMIAIAIQGMLRDGVTTWMPSYISNTYNLSSEISILSGIVLPLFGMLCFYLAIKIHMEKLKNPVFCAGVFFLAGTLSAIGICAVTGSNAVLSVGFSAILTGAMHGVNVMLICMIPPLFKKSGNVSTVSGIINSCTYVGSAISTYGIARIEELFGWTTTLLVWAVVASIGTLICFCVSKIFERKYM